MGLHFDFAGAHAYPKSGQIPPPPPVDCDASTENAKTVLSITCTWLKKGYCSNWSESLAFGISETRKAKNRDLSKCVFFC